MPKTCFRKDHPSSPRAAITARESPQLKPELALEGPARSQLKVLANSPKVTPTPVPARLIRLSPSSGGKAVPRLLAENPRIFAPLENLPKLWQSLIYMVHFDGWQPELDGVLC
jgi:hypothetical protein